MNRSTTFLIVATLILSPAALITSCSTVNPDSPLSFVDPSGNHPDGWITAHGSYASPDGSLCVDCHGADLLGGITGVSCSSDAAECHAGGPAFHPEDWLDSSLDNNGLNNDWHGEAYDNGFRVNGIDNCADCHGTILGVIWPDLPDPSDCVECHFTSTGGKYPIGSVWTHGAENHSDFLGSPEESVCVACHDVNISFGNQPYCHNCHGPGGVHPEPDWAERAQHGVAAKQDPGVMTGFGTCASCHGDDLDGGTSGTSCLTVSGCHGVAAPHPDDSTWRGESTPTHTNTDRDNSPVCGLCHLGDREPPVYQPLPGGSNPGCFDNTLCHGNED